MSYSEWLKTLLNIDLREFGLETSAILLRCTVKKVSHTACCVGCNQPVTQKGASRWKEGMIYETNVGKKCPSVWIILLAIIFKTWNLGYFVQMFLWYSCSYCQLFIWKWVTNENRRAWGTDRHPDRLCHLASLLFYPSTNRVRMSRHIPLPPALSLTFTTGPFPLSASGHYEVELKVPTEPPPPEEAHSSSAVSEAKHIKARQI